MIQALRMIHFLVFFVVSMKLSPSAQDEMQFAFHGFHGANLQVDGIAEILPNGLLQLTNSSKQQKGHAFYQQPVKFNMSSSKLNQPYSFSTSFVFAIVPQLPDISGHGITFVLSPSLDCTQAMASQFLGLFNSSSNGVSSNHVVAVELDTIQSPEFEDINDNHVGIDINSLISNVSAPVTYFSDTQGINKSLKLISGDPIQVWIDYSWIEKLIKVTVAPPGVGKPIRPLLSASLDLSRIILDTMYVGFSSATGAVASKHYILGWSFNRSGEVQNLDFSKLPSPPWLSKPSKPRKNLNLKILLPVLVSIALLAITGIIYIVRKVKHEDLRENWEQESGPQRFSYNDLYKATKGFRDRELLGAGGFGKVYRGVLPSTKAQIAVKKISHDSSQGKKEFVAEIVSMGSLRHRNLVQLLGYCRCKGELLLVYDYMSNGSLDKFLFTDEKPNLGWSQRYQIIRGIASGLLYLHEGSEKIVLHRDVKASNVLLDADLNGRLGDFGLARFCDHGDIPQTTNIVGTIGYLAPELTRTGKATTSSDVFAFGAFLLEMACGKRPIDLQRSTREIILVDWVSEHWKNRAILQTTDPRLEGNYVPEQMELVLKLGLLCSHSNPGARPCMSQVRQYLDGNVAFPEVLLEGSDVGTAAMRSELSAEFNMSFPIAFESSTRHFLSSSESIVSSGR